MRSTLVAVVSALLVWAGACFAQSPAREPEVPFAHLPAQWLEADEGPRLELEPDDLPRVDASLREADYTFDLSTIAFIDRLHGWLADQYGGIFETTDGGTSWMRLGEPSPLLWGDTGARGLVIYLNAREDGPLSARQK